MKSQGTKCTFILVVVRPTVADFFYFSSFLCMPVGGLRYDAVRVIHQNFAILSTSYDLAAGAQMIDKFKLSTKNNSFPVDSVDCFLHMHSVVLHLLISNCHPLNNRAMTEEVSR